MIAIAAFAVLGIVSMGLPALAANPDCEKKMKDTQMMVHPEDPRIICESRPSAATQDCLVELLNKGRGKLKGKDLFEVYGICTADPSQAMRDCMLKGLDKTWNDPGYQGAQKIGNSCMKSLRDQRMKALRDEAAKPQEMTQ